MRKGCCKYFNGTQNEICKAGVNVRELVGGTDFGWCARIPCYDSPFRKDMIQPKCDKRIEPTDQEIEELEKRIAERMLNITKAIDAIQKKHKIEPEFEPLMDNNKKSARGDIECPKCGGKLSYSIAGGNHHIHGKCETENCLLFMM